MLVSADNNPAEVSIHDLGAQSTQAAYQLLEELGHQAVDDAVQQRVGQQAVAVAAEVAVHCVEDVVRDPAGALGGLPSGPGGLSGGDLLNAFGYHSFEDTV